MLLNTWISKGRQALTGIISDSCSEKTGIVHRKIIIMRSFFLVTVADLRYNLWSEMAWMNLQKMICNTVKGWTLSRVFSWKISIFFKAAMMSNFKQLFLRYKFRRRWKDTDKELSKYILAQTCHFSNIIYKFTNKIGHRNHHIIKDHLRYKTIFCYKVACDV